jgi:glycosyltransferase involved in cell wall biosynthesis
MRVLLAHNYYQKRGGEDAVFENEARLLADHGHEVALHVVNNASIVSLLEKSRAFVRTPWSLAAARAFRSRVEEVRPDIVHLHNIFPQLTPSVYGAAQGLGVPVVQTLHNFRIGCASGFLHRDGHVCQDCIGRRLPLQAIRHRCYRGSVAGSLATAGMIAVHQARGTWRTHVDRYIALTEFARAKHIEMGLPADRVTVKPNFVPDRGAGDETRRQGVLFVGRLAAEKGVAELVRAWAGAPVELRIAGTGPLEAVLRREAAGNVTFLGHLGPGALLEAYRSAALIVLPSTGYESMPMVLLEAWSTGLPAIAFRHSAFAEMIEDGVTGLLVASGDHMALRERIDSAIANPELVRAMGRAARTRYEQRYSAEVNYGMLVRVYHEVLRARAAVTGLAAGRGGAQPERAGR